MPTIPLNVLTAAAFAPYGTLIAHDGELEANFQVIVDEPDAAGWRIAVNRVTAAPIVSLGRHPNTRESFEPLSGTVVLVVAEPGEPDRLEAFVLDQPVCLFVSVWHATIAIGKPALVKITENHTVRSEAYALPGPLHIGLID